MVQLLGGAEIPIQAGMGLESTIGGGAIPFDISEGFGPSPAETQMAYDLAQKQRAIEAEAQARAEKIAQLAEMEATAAEAHEQYYEVGGTGYGTTPGGPDVYYFDYGQAQPTTYEKGTFLGADLPGLPGKNDLLLYGALAIGALALLKR